MTNMVGNNLNNDMKLNKNVIQNWINYKRYSL